jgi:hypothetical protein
MIDTIVSGILAPVFSIIDKAIPDKTRALELKADIEKAVIENRAELQKTMREIAVAEVSGNWFQSSWRPLLSYLFIFLVFWVFFLKGVLELSFGVTIESGTGEEIMTFGTVWAAVYGLGRTFEKTGSSVSFKRD